MLPVPSHLKTQVRLLFESEGKVGRDGRGSEAHRGREVKTSSGAVPEKNKS